MLGYFKRVGEEGEGAGGAAGPKRPRTTDKEASTGGGSSSPPPSQGDPSTIVTWNANGLGVRLGKNWEEFEEYMISVMPDACCIQEVGGPQGQGVAGEGRGVGHDSSGSVYLGCQGRVSRFFVLYYGVVQVR